MKKLLQRIIQAKFFVHVLIVVFVFFAIASQKYLGADNVVEEAVEIFIEEETGVEVELSPDSVVSQDKELFKQLSRYKLLH